MPATSYAFADPRAQTIWEGHLFDYSVANHIFGPLMGKTHNAFIHVNKELTTKKGGTIVMKARERLAGAGQGDDGNTSGNAQQIKRRNMSLTVHTRMTRTESAGKMSEQLTDSDFREDSKVELGDWIKEALENDINTASWGGYNVNSSSGDIETINESAPSSARIYRGGQAADGTLGNGGATYATTALMTAGTQANNLMGMKLMEMIKRRALAATPRFRGSMVPDLSKADADDIRDGVPTATEGIYFLVLVNPLGIKAIRAETGEAGWRLITASAQVRGDKNPIFSGAAFLWDKMIFWEYDRSPTRTGAGGTTLAEGFTLNADRDATTDAAANARTASRAVLMGADALALGWAQNPAWAEDFEDANIPFIKTDMLYGVKRMRFNAHGTTTPGQDEAIYVIEHEVIADS